ncbi:hypothetical protein [Nostoc sp. C117]|uniref:hypothetical protein n=1 Tax=Nostoc sp. C117 TaxID=3349875 RepID=UPI00370D7E07
MLYQLPFSSIFGGDSSQDATKITIAKSNLPTLTPNENNHAEQLLTAILIQTLNSFSGDIITHDGNKIDLGDTDLGFDNSDAFEFLKVFQWKPFYKALNKTDFVEVKQIVYRRFEASGNEYED